MDNLPDVLKAEHIMEFLGMSKGKVYDLMRISVDAGGIPAMRIGRNVRVLKTDLLEWLEKQKEV